MLKMSWDEFVRLAIERLNTKYPVDGEPRFRKSYGYEADGDMYDFPTYVEIDLKADVIDPMYRGEPGE